MNDYSAVTEENQIDINEHTLPSLENTQIVSSPQKEISKPYRSFSGRTDLSEFGKGFDFLCMYLECDMEEVAAHCSLNQSTISRVTRLGKDKRRPGKEIIAAIWKSLMEIAAERGPNKLAKLSKYEEWFYNSADRTTDEQKNMAETGFDKFHQELRRQLEEKGLPNYQMRKTKHS